MFSLSREHYDQPTEPWIGDWEGHQLAEDASTSMAEDDLVYVTITVDGLDGANSVATAEGRVGPSRVSAEVDEEANLQDHAAKRKF